METLSSRDGKRDVSGVCCSDDRDRAGLDPSLLIDHQAQGHASSRGATIGTHGNQWRLDLAEKVWALIGDGLLVTGDWVFGPGRVVSLAPLDQGLCARVRTACEHDGYEREGDSSLCHEFTSAA